MSGMCVNVEEDKTAGFFYTDSALKYMQRVFLLQLPLVTVIQAILQVFLKPLGETPVVGQILGGLLIGPSGLGMVESFQDTLFPDQGISVLETLGNYGCMFYLFLVGVKMDLSNVKKSSKIEKVIGILTFILPMVITIPLSFHLKQYVFMDPDVDTERTFKSMKASLPIVAILMSNTSFHVIACFLADLKVLNTELGRLATSASTISGMLSWITLEIGFAINQLQEQGTMERLWYVFSAFGLVIFITLVLRNIVLWIIKKTPEGAVLHEIHLCLIFLMVLGCGFLGECFGQHYFFGPMILGMAIPNGPPVGSTMADKLETFISGLLLPLYFFCLSSKVDVVNMKWTNNTEIVLLISSCASLGKIIATIIPCLYWRIPLRDTFVLALILATVGIFDLQTYTTALTIGCLDTGGFGYMIVYMLVIAGVTSPLVYWFYNPSAKYSVGKKRTIQNTKHNVELPLLVCIYNQENVRKVLDILEASNPTKESPIIIYMLHVVELLGRSTPLLITHKANEDFLNKPSISDQIINSFKIFEKQNQGALYVQPFTSITPVVTANDDVCTLAFQKKTSLVIIPFHKQWNIDGTMQSSKWRNTNKKVLDKAPCSVGILIDHGIAAGASTVHSGWSSYSVLVIFLGGADDREALYYAMRMTNHPKIKLTVQRIIPINYVVNNVPEKRVDGDLINEYRLGTQSNPRCRYTENLVRDGVEMVTSIRSMQNSYDLILAGRRHYNYSNLLSALMEWSEYPELGFFGDLLASSDFEGDIAVLVMQQSSNAVDTVPETEYQV